jgi:hypothetical protein
MPEDPRFLPPTPFSRLVVTHALGACADACVAVSLAGSLFFASPTSGSREKLLLYLLITVAPFAVVWPVLGPALDRTRGGRRLLVVGSMIGRTLLCVVMSRYITKEAPEGLLVFPLAFGVLVLQKGYSIAKSSLVPALVSDDASLVKANSRLALISSIATICGGAPAALLVWIADADWSLILAAVVFAAAAVLAVKIPRTEVAARPKEDVELEREELHQPSILLAGSAMGVMRGVVGFMAFFTAFSLKNDIIGLGFAGGCAVAGVLLGNVCAPLLRERVREEVMLASAIVGAAASVLIGALVGGVLGFAIAGLAIGFSAAAGKVGFDSLLQRDGPDAVRGRAFARFETRFQITWVIGGLLGIIPLNSQVGLLAMAAVLVFTAVSYVAALRAARGRVYRTTIRPKAVDKMFFRARGELRERRDRSRTGRRKAAAERRADRDADADPPMRGNRPGFDDATEPGPRRPLPPPRRTRRPSRTPGASQDPDAFPGGS